MIDSAFGDILRVRVNPKIGVRVNPNPVLLVRVIWHQPSKLSGKSAHRA